MSNEELKAWIKENLLIESEYMSNASDSLDQSVTLRFKDEQYPFDHCEIYVPND